MGMGSAIEMETRSDTRIDSGNRESRNDERTPYRVFDHITIISHPSSSGNAVSEDSTECHRNATGAHLLHSIGVLFEIAHIHCRNSSPLDFERSQC